MTLSAPGPTVSVVIPAYEGVRWLPATLDSLAAQTLTDWEAIVVDDCSPDEGAALVEQWPDKRVRLLRLPRNGGPVRARNAGVAAARGRYIAGLDQDDLCRPERLAAQVAYLDAHPACALLGTQVDYLVGDRVTRSTYPPVTTPGLIAWLLQIENPLAWSTVMVRAEVARAIDPFTRPELLYAEDFDLYGRVLRFGSIARLDQPLLLYRQHEGGVSKRFVAAMGDTAARVLTERHAALGDGAARAAALIVAHVMGRDPVPHRATLAELGALLTRLQSAFVSEKRPDATTSRLIRWETARRWERIGRTSLRAGALTLTDLLAVRPPHLGLGYAGVDTLAVAGLIGTGRRVLTRGR